jgi:predicted PurR-regulated permease PerM
VIAFLSVLVVIGAVAWLVTWTVSEQWQQLKVSAGQGIDRVQDFLTHLPFGIDQSQLHQWRESAEHFATSGQAGSAAISGLSTVAHLFTGLLLTIVVLFFFLKDGPRIWQFLLLPFTGRQRERAQRVGRHAVSALGAYVRGTAIVAAVDALFIGIGLAVVQVPMAIPLAVIVFITSFIPIAGAIFAGFLAALVSLVTNGLVTSLIVVGIVVVVDQLEAHLLQPVVMGRSLKLHPLVILIALAIGTLLASVIGAILAVPIAAVLWRIVKVWNGDDEPALPAKPHRRGPD